MLANILTNSYLNVRNHPSEWKKWYLPYSIRTPYIAIACEAECSATISNLIQFENRNLTGLYSYDPYLPSGYIDA